MTTEECICQDSITQDGNIVRKTTTYRLALTLIGGITLTTLIFNILYSTLNNKEVIQPQDFIVNSGQETVLRMLNALVTGENNTRFHQNGVNTDKNSRV